MSNVPTRPIVGVSDIASSLKSAVSADGSSVTSTANVFNTMQDKDRITLTLTNGGENSVDRENVWIFPGAWMATSTHSLPTDVTANIRNFTDWAEFVRYFLGGVETTIIGIKMTSDDTENFDSEIIVYAKAPNGKVVNCFQIFD